MISTITILLFFIYLWSFGFSLTYFIYLKSPSKPDFVEREIMNLGIGLGIFAILSIIINFFRIPLDWRLFLGLSLAVPLYVGFKHFKTKGFKLSGYMPSGLINAKRNKLSIATTSPSSLSGIKPKSLHSPSCLLNLSPA